MRELGIESQELSQVLIFLDCASYTSSLHPGIEVLGGQDVDRVALTRNCLQLDHLPVNGRSVELPRMHVPLKKEPGQLLQYLVTFRRQILEVKNNLSALGLGSKFLPWLGYLRGRH